MNLFTTSATTIVANVGTQVHILSESINILKVMQAHMEHDSEQWEHLGDNMNVFSQRISIKMG